MELVAVIDLMDGRVVRARGGLRSHYRPIESRLCAGADPLAVVAALLCVHAFRVVYVADLDAIMRRGDNTPALRRIRHGFPELTIWLDAGISDLAGVAELAGAAVPVLGSESLRDRALLSAAAACDPAPILSLDFRGGTFLGPAEVLAASADWPARVIVMNLDRVGSVAGPDLALMRSLRRRAPTGDFYLAGGVRDRADLAAARRAGAAGVLLASALHDGVLNSGDLVGFV